ATHPGRHRAFAPGRPAAASRFAGTSARVAGSGASEGHRSGTDELSRSPCGDRLGTPVYDDFLQFVGVHGPGKRDVGDLCASGNDSPSTFLVFRAASLLL